MAIDWRGLGQDILVGLEQGLQHSKFLHFLVLDRSSAIQQISVTVDRCSFAEVAKFERWFLWNCSALHDPDLKVRAAELYAWLKVKYYIRYGDFTFADEHNA